MNEGKIVFNYPLTACNRNGYYTQTGIDIYKWKDNGSLQITGLTSKGHPAVGFIKVPKENIQDLIDQLEKLK